MEAYIIVITTAITAIAVAYKIATDYQEKMYIIRRGSYQMSNINVGSGVSCNVYLKLKAIEDEDIIIFNNMINTLDWKPIIDSIINMGELTEIEYTTQVQLSGKVIIECRIELPIPILVDIKFGIDNKINITKK